MMKAEVIFSATLMQAP